MTSTNNSNPDSGTEFTGLPSLLMQAAHSAAVADGLVPKDSSNNPAEVSTGSAGDSDKASVTNPDTTNAQNSQSVASSTTTTTKANNDTSTETTDSVSKKDDVNGSETNRSTVEAALAMVAAGNSKVKIEEETAANTGDNEDSSSSEVKSDKPISEKDQVNNSPNTTKQDQPQQQQQGQSSNNSNINDNNVAKSLGTTAHLSAVPASTQGQAMTSTIKPTMNTPLSTTPTTVSTVSSAPISASASVQNPTALAPPQAVTMIPQPRTQTNNVTNVGATTSPAPRLTNNTNSTNPVSTTSVPPATVGKKKGPPLRRGKWTAEEEAYANRLIVEFKAGLLPLTDGTTLRTFLSKLLNCDPMRISKKFVGNNCIGKQVFRRRTADINRLTPEQIQQSRAELSELERRFLERVAQTNRVKSSGVGNNASGANTPTNASVVEVSKLKQEELDQSAPPSPPWLRPPNGFKHGTGAATAASMLSSGTVNRTALIGRALLQGNSSLNNNTNQKDSSLRSSGSAGLLALMELQRLQSQQNLLGQTLGNSANNLLDISQNVNGDYNNLTGSALAQIARNASAARMGGLSPSGNSMTNLMMKTGLSMDQLSQLVKDRQNSSNSLSNMMGRQGSLDALMSLDFQSLQSIDNLANLIQTGANPTSRLPKSGMKNWDGNTSTNSLAAIAATLNNNSNSNNNLSSLANSLIRSLSSNNVATRGNRSGGDSNANFQDLLQSMQSNLNNNSNNSANNLFGQAASALDLANLLRTDSSTGLTALRMQDGLAQRNSSVEDFLSLVANGDIPHQDPHMLNVPLQSVLQQQNQKSNASAAAQYLAQQQQLLSQATNGSNPSLSQQIASMNSFNGQSSVASLLSQFSQQKQQHSKQNESTTTGLTQQQQARTLALESLKRKFSITDMAKDNESQQGFPKR